MQCCRSRPCTHRVAALALRLVSRSQITTHSRSRDSPDDAAADCPAFLVPRKLARLPLEGKRPCCADAAARTGAGTSRPGQITIGFAAHWHEGPADATLLLRARLGVCLALPVQTQELLYSKPPHPRHPLRRTPGAESPPSPRVARPTARFIEYNSVLCPDRLLRCHTHC